MPSLRGKLFGPNARPGYSDALVEPESVRATILAHPEFAAFREQVLDVLAGWSAANIEKLRGIQQDDDPKALIHAISEDLLARFAAAPLTDRYDAYQRIMAYWAEAMQDDAYIIAGEGWDAARELREARSEVSDDGKVKWLEEADLVVKQGKTMRLVADVLPPRLIIARFFSDRQEKLDAAEARAEELSREIEELVEEHGQEGGLLSDALTDAGKITAGSVKARLKATDVDAEETAALKHAAKLIESEAAAKKEAKDIEAALIAAVLKQYPQLTDTAIRELVVEDKWLRSLSAAIQAEIEARTEQLNARVRALTERYGKTLPDMADKVELLSSKVFSHLQAMGFTS